jgi:hypothetical protein
VWKEKAKMNDPSLPHQPVRSQSGLRIQDNRDTFRSFYPVLTPASLHATLKLTQDAALKMQNLKGWNDGKKVEKLQYLQQGQESWPLLGQTSC